MTETSGTSEGRRCRPCSPPPSSCRPPGKPSTGMDTTSCVATGPRCMASKTCGTGVPSSRAWACAGGPPPGAQNRPKGVSWSPRDPRHRLERCPPGGAPVVKLPCRRNDRGRPRDVYRRPHVPRASPEPPRRQPNHLDRPGSGLPVCRRFRGPRRARPRRPNGPAGGLPEQDPAGNVHVWIVQRRGRG